jgi:Holliday junction DNA helicase RuvB
MTSPNSRPDALRPTRLAEFGGQPDIARDLNILLGAARKRQQLPDHMCFAGPPGLGKTSLAHIIAHELSLPLVATSGPAVEKSGDLAAMLTEMNRDTVVFIDEIHRLPRSIEEYLYSPMEDGMLELTVGSGDKSRVVRLPLAPFVLVGATTQLGALSAPLRDRFGYTGRLKLYENDALADIVTRSAGLLDVAITVDGAYTIAGRSRGTPRIANRMLRRVRDWAQMNDRAEIDAETAEAALTSFGVDAIGLDALARDILTALIVQFGGGPVGLKTLAAAVGEDESTISDVYESHLMRVGLLTRTPRGRVATAAAYTHLGMTPPPAAIVAGAATGQLGLPGMADPDVA